MDKSKKIQRIILLSFLAIIAIAEIVFMLYDNDTATLAAMGMFLVCIPDTVISFIKKDELKWWDFGMMIIYLVLALVGLVRYRT